MPTNAQQASRNFGTAQTILLFGFAVAYFFDRSSWIFAPGGLMGGLGVALSVAGLLLMLAAFLALRGVIQIAPEPKAGGHLVTSGVYSMLRHPIYTAILLVVIGLFLRKPTLLVAAAGILVIAFLLVKVRLEERLLLERYPDYAAYMSRSWGVIPGLGRGSSGGAATKRDV